MNAGDLRDWSDPHRYPHDLLRYEKSGCYWSWSGGLRGANGATQSYNKTEKGLGGKFENRVSEEVADIELAKKVWDGSEFAVGLEPRKAGNKKEFAIAGLKFW
jgi:hypothetical protein